MGRKGGQEQRRVLPPFPRIELSVVGDSVTAVFFVASAHPVGEPAMANVGHGTVGSAGGRAAAGLASAHGLKFCRVHATDAVGQVEELTVDVAAAKLVPVGADGTISVGVLPTGGSRAGNSLHGRKGLGFAAIGLLVALVGGAVWVVGGALPRGDEGAGVVASAASTNAPAQLPVLPPPGFDTYAAWSVPVQDAGLGSSGPVVRVFGDTVWVASGSSVSRYDAATGALLGRTEAGFKVAALVRTDLGSGASVAAYDGRRRVQSFGEDGSAGTVIDFGEKVASVSFGGDRPMGSEAGTSTPATVRVWTIDDSGTVQERLIPAGAVALASMGGSVFAVNVEESTGWWISTSDPRFPEAIKISPPTVLGTLKTSMGGAGSVVDGYWIVKVPVNASAKETEKTQTAAVKLGRGNLGNWLEPSASALVPGAATSAAGAGASGVNGNMLCSGAGAWDLSTGKAVPVPAGSTWNGAGCAGGQLWLRKADSMIRLDAQGNTIASTFSKAYTNTSVLGISSTGLAIVQAENPDGQALYGLEPAKGTK